ncbi:TetR/AcrR family transcriptional regulator [Mycobacterium sp. Marseille-P9652]|uniref:TetR/AcrR family transcriptional regulator n=1 Tax=Mycobacterium sp. Marseille-P9652 TaxID=2654950 RepID=UPI0012E8DEDE|nr:TetR family transcriptional regulator [Mycobacterium sp. Marseille-P9652]
MKSVAPRLSGARERRKAQTRQALISTAVKLFSEYGFDTVTVAEIAAHADVDDSTFFRHFPTKEAVLYAPEDVAQLLETALRSRPAAENLISSMTTAFETVVYQSSVDTEQIRLRLELSRESAALSYAETAYWSRWERTCAGAFAARGYPEREAALLGAAFVTAARFGLDLIIDEPAAVSRDAIVRRFRDALDALHELGGLGPT